MNKKEMLIIPNPHGFYVRTKDRIIPLKPVAHDSMIQTLNEEQLKKAADTNSNIPLPAGSILGYFDRRTQTAFLLPLDATVEESTQIDGVKEGHEIMPFSYPAIRCTGISSFGLALRSDN